MAPTDGRDLVTNRVFLGAIIVVALALRLYLAVDVPYIHDEENNAIPLAGTISFQPGSLHLPLRGENHGALPAYVVKVSSLLFGTSRLGYRALHILLSLVTVVLIYRLANDWYGPVAARWAAALLAFNEYYLPISARATAHVPYLLLVVVALYAFSRFLSSQKPAWLYGAGAAVGLAFYCKEHAALLVPVFLLTMLHPRLRHWLRRPQPYVAALVFTAFLAPDFYWNATTSPETIVDYGNQPALQARYSNHLRRVGGIGFSPYPLMFYARSAVLPFYAQVVGRPLTDETKEYSSINPVLGLLLLGCVVATVFVRRSDLLRVFLLVAFGFVFLLFTFIAKGDPPGRLDPVSWIWVESTMFPAIVLAGALVAASAWRTRVALSVGLGLALVYGVAQVLIVGT
ncbi:MAG: glycosyltransferase family 39 protein [Vicinamibacterales bacterium]